MTDTHDEPGDPHDHFKPGLGDVTMVLAFTGLRWEEAAAVSIENVDLDGQWITVDRTASESGHDDGAIGPPGSPDLSQPVPCQKVAHWL